MAKCLSMGGTKYLISQVLYFDAPKYPYIKKNNFDGVETDNGNLSSNIPAAVFQSYDFSC